MSGLPGGMPEHVPLTHWYCGLTRKDHNIRAKHDRCPQCVEVENNPLGTRSALSALEARCGELEAMQPREWTAETIKGAPEGLYFGKSADKWRTDRSFSKMIIDGFLAAANAQRGRGEEGPRFPYTHYFGPIPQPSSNSRKEGEG